MIRKRKEKKSIKKWAGLGKDRMVTEKGVKVIALRASKKKIKARDKKKGTSAIPRPPSISAD